MLSALYKPRVSHSFFSQSCQLFSHSFLLIHKIIINVIRTFLINNHAVGDYNSLRNLPSSHRYNIPAFNMYSFYKIVKYKFIFFSLSRKITIKSRSRSFFNKNHTVRGLKRILLYVYILHALIIVNVQEKPVFYKLFLHKFLSLNCLE